MRKLATRWLSGLCTVVVLTRVAFGCPFCTAVAPSLSQQRESSAVVALGEVLDADSRPPQFRLHRVLKGGDLLANQSLLTADAAGGSKTGTLVLLFADKQAEKLAWSATPVNETSAAYFLRAPQLRTPTAERLRYFASFLEHADPLVAEDAYREFGHARFNEVAQVADTLPSERLRAWVKSDRVPEARKGFYGLALGLAQDPAERDANAKFLKGLITADANDFRAGFDGVLGGYLLLTGADGLQLIESRFLANKQAKVGDVRHVLTALRFYHEYGREISAPRQRAAIAKLLARPEFSESAITDLARLNGWEFCDAVAALYDRPAFSAPEIRRSIIGYLRACPNSAAIAHLARLRTQDPTGVADAEAILSKLGKLPQ